MINKLSNELEAAKKTSDMAKQLEPTTKPPATKPSPRRPARKRRVSSSGSDEEVIVVTEMRVMGGVEDEEPLGSGGEDEMPEEIDEVEDEEEDEMPEEIDEVEDEEEMAEEVDWMQEKMDAINKKMDELRTYRTCAVSRSRMLPVKHAEVHFGGKLIIPMSVVSILVAACARTIGKSCKNNGFLVEGEPAMARYAQVKGFTSGNFDHMCLKAIERSRTVVAAHPDRNLLPYFFWDMQGTEREIPYDLKKFKQQQNLTIKKEKRLLNSKNDPVSISCTCPKCNSQAIFFVSAQCAILMKYVPDSKECQGDQRNRGNTKRCGMHD